MELRDLLETIESKVKKARNAYDVANHNNCQFHIGELWGFLNEQPELKADSANEEDELPDGI